MYLNQRPFKSVWAWPIWETFRVKKPNKLNPFAASRVLLRITPAVESPTCGPHKRANMTENLLKTRRNRVDLPKAQNGRHVHS